MMFDRSVMTWTRELRTSEIGRVEEKLSPGWTLCEGVCDWQHGIVLEIVECRGRNIGKICCRLKSGILGFL